MRKVLIAVCSLLCFCCVSCLDIVEEITLNADGSGSYEMRMDFKEAMEMMMTMMPDSVKGNMDADQLLDSMANEQGLMGQMGETLDMLNEQDGISNAQQSISDGVFTMSYNFRDATSLNGSLNREGGMDNPFGLSPATFAGKKGRFSRIQSAEDKELDAETEQMMEMMEMMMADASYTTIYTFPGKVKKSSNKEVSWSNGNKTLTLKADLLDVFDNPSVLNNEIKYKRK